MQLRNRKQRRSRRRTKNSFVHASIEHIEERCLLAGVVGVSLSNNGNLTVTGDDAANEIAIGNIDDSSGYIVGLGGTLIDFDGMVGPGMSFPLTTLTTIAGDFPGLDGNLTINMGDGDDLVNIVGTDGPLRPFVTGGDLDVNLGHGDDDFFQEISYVGGDAEIRGSHGDDTIQLNELVYAGDTYLHTGHADSHDELFLTRAHFMEAELRGSSGETRIQFNDGTVQTSLEVNTGDGNDEFWMNESGVGGDVHIDTGSADSNNIPGDYVIIGHGVIAGDLTIDGRGGMQTIDFHPPGTTDSFIVVGETTIRTRGGNDRIFVQDAEPHNFVGDVDIKTGGGHDEVDIQAQTVFESDLSINLGGGHDNLLFSAMVAVGGDGTLKGAGGSDSISSDYLFATWNQGIPDLLSIENVI